MIYTVTFNPAIDYVVALKGELQPGKINRNANEDFFFGGKGINVSNVLRSLGYESVALGFVAGFTGTALEQGLQDLGQRTDFVQASTGMTRINVKIRGGQETQINGIGPEITPVELEQFYAKLEKLTGGDILILSGSIPRCLPENSYEQIMERFSDRGIRFVVDGEGELLLNTLKYRPFLIKPNHHELGALFGKKMTADEEILACARRLQDMGARNVLVSMGDQGAMLLDEQGICHRIGCPPGQVINTVGAGDSMVAGFLAGFIQTGGYGYALRLGTAAGSATAFSSGLGTEPKIRQLMEKI